MKVVFSDVQPVESTVHKTSLYRLRPNMKRSQHITFCSEQVEQQVCLRPGQDLHSEGAVQTDTCSPECDKSAECITVGV